MLRNSRYALRGFARNPGFAAIAILTLALGIGANTAIFSVMDALLLRPLPFAKSEGLVLLSIERKEGPLRMGPFSWTRFEELRAQSRSLPQIAAFTNETFHLTGTGDPEQIPAMRASWNFFRILGVQPALGRPFREAEDQPGGPAVAIVSDGFWKRHFAGDVSLSGQHLTLDQKDYAIIGVLPAGFRFDALGTPFELVTTRPDELNILTPQQLRGGTGFLNAIARLAPGVSRAAAQAEMDALAARYRQEHAGLPDTDPNQVVRAGGLLEDTVANYRTAVLILFGAVGLVLLIACGNVAALLLARALGRKREAAIRMALGAGRAALIRQQLTESLFLALTGGGLGAALSLVLTRVLGSWAAAHLPRGSEIAVDGRVLLFTLAVSAGVGILFGLAPALQIARQDCNAALRAEGRGATAGRQRHAALRVLIAAQVALSMVLLAGAGLLLRNFAQIRSAGPGFDAGHLLTLNVTLPASRYARGAQMVSFFDELLREVRGLPGVQAAVAASALPANPARFSPALVEGQPPIPLAERPLFIIQTATPGYVETLRVPLRRGRDFTEHDGAQGPRVAMVNESLARRYWPGANPIGKHIWLGRQTNPVEVVGVLGDVRNVSLAADSQPEIYLPFAQLPWAFMNVIVRTEGDPLTLAAAVRGRVLALDREQPVTLVRSMDEVVDQAAAQPRFTTWLLGALAGAAALLALVGIYGVVARSTAERTAEMGIRLALGASPADLLKLVLRQGLTVTLAGIVIGLAASLALTRLLRSQLYHVSATDPAVLLLSAALLAGAATLASYLPALRAARIDPIEALRTE